MGVLEEKTSLRKMLGLPLALLVLAVMVFMPQPEGLPVAGQHMLALLLFSVILWMSEGVSYPVSAAVILSLITVLIGTAPIVTEPTKIYGMGRGLTMGLGGLANTAWALVAAAMFLAAAMQITGLDRRIALKILSVVGAKTRNVLAGVIFVGFALSFFVPSTTARVACIVPIILGMIAAFGVAAPAQGNFADKLANVLFLLIFPAGFIGGFIYSSTFKSYREGGFGFFRFLFTVIVIGFLVIFLIKKVFGTSVKL